MPTLTAKAVEWLERRSGEKPFFLYFTPVAVHRPITPSKRTAGTSPLGPYGDWIHELDLSVGRVLEVLDRKNFTANTLVIFTSDNGGVNKPTLPGYETEAAKSGLAICGPFRGGKHDVWEGGFRVPFIVRWPGHVPPNSVCDEMMSVTDILATVAAIVGEELPSPTVGAEDSYNMLPAWLGQSYSSPIRPDMIVHSADGNFAIRRGKWKWIEGTYHPDTRPGALRLRADQFHPQLYDLSTDIAETRDVAAEHPEVVAELSRLLNHYRDCGHSRQATPPDQTRREN